MTGESIGPEAFINAFREHLSQVDDAAQVNLKGHLEVELHLDDAFGAAMCSGFLVKIEEQLMEMRGFIESALHDHRSCSKS